MFLAVKELRHDIKRFSLVIFLIIMISYLTYFLTALAYGLATSYTQGIDKWQAKGIFLAQNSNGSINRSLISADRYNPILEDYGKNAAVLGVSSATIDQDDTQDYTIFGLNGDSFLRPDLESGRWIENSGEVVADGKIKNIGLDIGDKINFSEGESYKIVGLTSGSTFQTQPIFYTSMNDWRKITTSVSGMSQMKDLSAISAIIVKKEDAQNQTVSGLIYQNMNDFNFSLPGYSAQVATFSLMVCFLIFISSFILAVFIYILTSQKRRIFGILKSDGVSSSYIGKSVMVQILVLMIFGILIGLLLVLLSGLLIGSKIPFKIYPPYFIVISLLFVFFAIIGGLSSVRFISKIDPVKVIN